MIERCDLGSGGEKIPRIGFGCWTIGGHGWGKVDDEQSIQAVHRALELGIDFFDTADVYGLGHSEKILSKALGKRRKDMLIATKFGVKWDKDGRISRDISRESIMQALHDSLRRLQLDCIPLYQIHWPDGKTRLSEAIETLQRCQEAGKVRYFGCCNMSAEQVLELQNCGPVASVQIPYSLVDRGAENAILPLCRRLRITPLAWGPLAHGLLSGKYGPESEFGQDDIRSRHAYFEENNYKSTLEIVAKLREIAASTGKTTTQVALRWVLDSMDGGCAITGIRSAVQIDENAGAMGWKLSSDDLSALDSAPQEIRSQPK